MVHQWRHVCVVNAASHSMEAVVSLLLPCHLHLRVELGRGSYRGLIGSVHIRLVTAILRLVILLLVVLLITVVALGSVQATVPRLVGGVLAKALVQVE